MKKNKERELKSVSLPKPLAKVVNSKLSEKGITFGEYARYLIMKDNSYVESDIPYVTEEEEKAIDNAMGDYREGRYVTLHNDDETEQYYQQLVQETK